jgi:hypothetical protein
MTKARSEHGEFKFPAKEFADVTASDRRAVAIYDDALRRSVNVFPVADGTSIDEAHYIAKYLNQNLSASGSQCLKHTPMFGATSKKR